MFGFLKKQDCDKGVHKHKYISQVRDGDYLVTLWRCSCGHEKEDKIYKPLKKSN